MRSDLNISQAKPALDQPGAQMNILNARVSEIDFASKQNSHPHVDSFFIERVTQRVIAEIKIWQREYDSRPR